MTPTNVKLQQVVDAMRGKRALVVGDVMLDRYVIGRVERISPEAPIPILRVGEESLRPGGAGNVAANLAALGLKVDLVGVVGRDAEARALQAALESSPNIKASLFAGADRRTTAKTRHIAGGQQLLRTDSEHTHPVDGTLEDRLIAAIERTAPKADAVVVSDYGKGCLTRRVLLAIRLATQARIPVVVDPFGRDWKRYSKFDYLKPNRAEIRDATGVDPVGDRSALAAARAAREQFKLRGILLSRAEAGLTLDDRLGNSLHFKAEAREVADVTGAGDSVVAAFAAALAAEARAPDAALIANLAGGIAVGHVGAYAVSAADLIHALQRDAVLAVAHKVVPRDHARVWVEHWREAGEKIGFTNGVFDLLHPGHVSLIAEAKRHCDRLVVAINADASVKRLKGPDRPIQDESARAMVLAALGDVDLVVVFEEDTPIPLLKLLKPDVLVKGGDYARAEVVGGDLVEGWGGKVRLARVVPGHSTSATVGRLKR